MSVSVVIPAYNAEAFLHRALESVLEQTQAVDEIIVVDDGSKDRTCDVARSYGNKVRVVSQKNQGPSAARNLGVEMATSELIAFLDADDAWFPGKIEAQLRAMEGCPEAILCYTSMMVQRIDGTQLLQRAASPGTLRNALRIGNPGITPSCVMFYRKRFLEAGGFDVKQVVGEDWSLWRRLLVMGPFCIVEEPTMYYFDSSTGQSSDPDVLYQEALRMVDNQLLDDLHGVSRWIWRRRILSHQAYQSAMAARNRGQFQKEIRYLVTSVLLWPSLFWIPKRFKAVAVTLTRALHRTLHT